MGSRRVRPSGPGYDGPRSRGGRHDAPGNTEYAPMRSPDRESRSLGPVTSTTGIVAHDGHVHTTSALPKNAKRQYAMGASDNTCSLPTAATPAGTNMQKTAESTGRTCCGHQGVGGGHDQCPVEAGAPGGSER
jgi:hypothetical protein